MHHDSKIFHCCHNVLINVSLFHDLYCIVFRLLPESIPWLVANGRVDQAEDIMKEAARFNGVTLPHKIFGAVDTESDSFDALTTNTETHHTHPDSQTKILNHKDKEALLDENIPVDTTHGEKTQDQEQCQYQVGLMTDNKSDMADQLVTKDDKSSIDNDATVHDMADSAFADDETDDHTDTSMDERLEMNKGAKTMKPLLMDDSRDDANQVTIVPRKPHKRLQNICGRICNKKRSPVQDEYAIAQYTCLDILRSRTMVLYSFIMCSVWWVDDWLFYGIILHVDSRCLIWQWIMSRWLISMSGLIFFSAHEMLNPSL